MNQVVQLIPIFIVIVLLLIFMSKILGVEDRDKKIFTGTVDKQAPVYNAFADGDIAIVMDAMKYNYQYGGTLAPPVAKTNPETTLLNTLPTTPTEGTPIKLDLTQKVLPERLTDKYMEEISTKETKYIDESGKIERQIAGLKPRAKVASSGPCEDYFIDCSKWAGTDQCRINPEYMLFACPRSCNVCSWTPMQKTMYSYIQNKNNPEINVYNGKPYPQLPFELQGPVFPMSTLGSMTLDPNLY